MTYFDRVRHAPSDRLVAVPTLSAAIAVERYGRFFGAPFRALMRDYLNRRSTEIRFDAVRLFETRNQLPNNYVMKVDKASMSVSVEARVPYLDQRVAEIAYRIPRNLTLGGRDGEKHAAAASPAVLSCCRRDASSAKARWQHGRVLARRATGFPAVCSKVSSSPRAAGPKP